MSFFYTGMLTDKYELTMLEASLADGTASTPCIFEVFSHSLPKNRNYGVIAGTGRLIEQIQAFSFSKSQLEYLSSFLNERTIKYLENYSFSGNIYGYAEGDTYFEKSPVLQVESSFAECVVLETLILSCLNYDTAVATAASRITKAANKKPCFEMGSRRTNEQSAVVAARAAYIGGFCGTSNLQAGYLYGIPTIGTAAHAFIMIHKTEQSAFESQVYSLSAKTTLLVDTYNVEQGVKNAIDIAGTQLGAVRIDSGNLVEISKQVREQLDSLGAKDTKIVATNDLDEYSIKNINEQNAPIDSFGVGTRVVTGSNEPTASFVYKLVQKNETGVYKKSESKTTIPYKKYPYRVVDNNKKAIRELVCTKPQQATAGLRSLFVQYISNGILNQEFVGKKGVENAQIRHRLSLLELPDNTFSCAESSAPIIPTTIRGVF